MSRLVAAHYRGPSFIYAWNQLQYYILFDVFCCVLLFYVTGHQKVENPKIDKTKKISHDTAHGMIAQDLLFSAAFLPPILQGYIASCLRVFLPIIKTWYILCLERIFGTPRPRIRKFKSRRVGKEMDLTRAGPTKLLRDLIVPHLSTSELAPPRLQIPAASYRNPVLASPTPTLAKLLPPAVDASLFWN
jgi:hypothetical protein